jgi:glycosyltransferase 2 family protein
MSRRAARVVGTLLVTGLAVAYLVWKVDVGQAVDTVADADPWWFLLAAAIMLVTVVPMAWRWQRLLAAHGIHDRVHWLTRGYLTAYAAGQILPTAIGGDAMRIYEATRRHPGRGGPIAGSVLLERALGGAATLVLGAVGLALAVGRYDVGAYLWIEAAFAVAAIALAVVLFARWLRPLLARLAPLLRRVRLDRPARAVYEAIHSYRATPRLLLAVFTLTLAIQSVRVLAIWATAEAVGIDLSVRVYYVMGPLFFLVLLVPFTLNGFAVREAFFVSFLGNLDVPADQAFAAGFLFFVLTLVLAAPGLAIFAVENVRRPRIAPRAHPAERTGAQGSNHRNG